MRARFRSSLPWVTVVALGSFSTLGVSQQERHGRGYKPPPPTAEVSVVVEKAFNSKPMPNVSVVFRAVRDGKLTANLETKTDPDGKALMDLLEIGSHVTVQVISTGYATFATDFDLTQDGRQVLVKLQRPRAQVSQYTDEADHPAVVQPGVQEHVASPPASSSPTGPLQTTPPANTPDTHPASTGTPKPDSPQ